jgi:hypothetical protein
VTDQDITTIRLRNQRISKPEGEAPADIVRWFGAIQAQDLEASLWAVGLRMARAVSEAAVERAIADRSVVRSWPMRGTIHLIPAEDARWILRLLAPRVDQKAAANYRRAGLSRETINQAGDVIARTLVGTLRTRAELYSALSTAGIPTSASNGEQRGMHLLVHWARHGLICITPRRGKQPTFGLLDEWVPNGSDLSGIEALAEMARRYLRSHGPATVDDFAWWTGVTKKEARSALEVVRREFDQMTLDGVEHWWSAGENPGGESPRAFLLPPFDEYTIAYVDRSAVVDHDRLASSGYGIGSNLIIDGRLAGLWKRTRDDDTVTIELRPTRSLSGEEQDLIPAAVASYARFLGLRPALKERVSQ